MCENRECLFYGLDDDLRTGPDRILRTELVSLPNDSQLYRYIAQLVVHAISVATGSGHQDYPGHLDHFLSGSKWVLSGYTYMPDPDPKYLIIKHIKNCNKRSILSNRAVTNISSLRMQSF